MAAWGGGTLSRSTMANQSGLALRLGLGLLGSALSCLRVCVSRGARGGNGKFWKVPELPGLVKAEERGPDSDLERTERAAYPPPATALPRLSPGAPAGSTGTDAGLHGSAELGADATAPSAFSPCLLTLTSRVHAHTLNISVDK